MPEYSEDVVLKDSRIVVLDKNGKEFMSVGGDKGDLLIKDEEGTPVIWLDGRKSEGLGAKLLEGLGAAGIPVYLNGNKGTMKLGANGIPGNISLLNKDNKISVQLDGEQGDVILQNADCAEEFPVTDIGLAEPGTVMAIGDDGMLAPCAEDRDSRVIGVVSGANGYKPAIIMDRDPGADNRVPIATMGKVYCKVDADQRPVRAGDLLTSSSILGHAMRLSGDNMATGAVIGKALAPLGNGRDMIPVLVMLR